MAEPHQHEITQLLRAWREGQPSVPEKLVPLVYGELHRLAKAYMARERPDHTLQTTALVHEAYLKLVDASAADWHDRAHFFAVCAQIMRRILVDSARSHRSLKRGGNLRPVQLEEALVVSPESEVDLVGLDDALEALAAIDPRKSRIMELRFFGGLSVEETAAVLKVSPETVLGDSKLAKSWLWRELSGEKSGGA
jgi:RNA polymerase sigma-70 factor (ECF subfamily)